MKFLSLAIAQNCLHSPCLLLKFSCNEVLVAEITCCVCWFDEEKVLNTLQIMVSFCQISRLTTSPLSYPWEALPLYLPYINSTLGPSIPSFCHIAITIICGEALWWSDQNILTVPPLPLMSHHIYPLRSTTCGNLILADVIYNKSFPSSNSRISIAKCW